MCSLYYCCCPLCKCHGPRRISRNPQQVIPTPDSRISPGAIKHRKTQGDKEQPGGRNLGVGISSWLLDLSLTDTMMRGCLR